MQTKLKDAGRDEHKLDTYYKAYDREIGSWQDKHFRLLEIGVQYGGSLLMWQKYFPKATIEGAELMHQPMVPGADKFTIHYGDQADKAFLEQFNNFDIIIDDGGHTWNQQQVTLETLWPKLNKGGVFIIEDLHTSYWPAFADAPRPTIDVLKDIIYTVNYDFAKADSRGQDMPAPELSMTDVASISFYPSMCFIHKL